ncbi:hypothetical protein C2845_PM11G02220 [Panicum miliaceum]|uniref:BZIP domain-containing protein n=1 Tax=Panicum miliaceum TaxID=4540 RepID=A0A3L6RPI0_PANMI|nr:hypothetical protein C2845_PM11G02220 [Panicum miliaceum]
MAAAGVGGGGEYDLPLEEVAAVLASFSGDPAAVFAPLPAPEAEAGASRELLAAGEGLREGLGEVEKFLMEDYEDEAARDADGVEEFLDGVLVGDGEDDGSPKSTGERSADGAGASAGGDEEVLGADGGDDPDSKKKKSKGRTQCRELPLCAGSGEGVSVASLTLACAMRGDCDSNLGPSGHRRRMRNKDSAMKSRERKKLYVKDLEMKSKYLEAECCRLSYALQCCAAENMALRQSLRKDRPVGAPTAMQESAVFMEKKCVFANEPSTQVPRLGPSRANIAMAAAGVGGGGDYDLPLEEVDAVLASFSGDPATIFTWLPAPEAEAGAAGAVGCWGGPLEGAGGG